MRLSEIQLDLQKSIDFNIEEFIEDMLDHIHTTREEFDRLYVIEQHPIEIEMRDLGPMQFEVLYDFRIKQSIKIRRKTIEEMTEDVSRHITQGEN